MLSSAIVVQSTQRGRAARSPVTPPAAQDSDMENASLFGEFPGEDEMKDINQALDDLGQITNEKNKSVSSNT